MEAVVAVYSDWGIGDGQTQPVTVRADRAHFREITDGAAVILGRKTMEDFPGGRPLKNRHNIVMTCSGGSIEGAETAGTVEEALRLAKNYGRCVVIGGASVYSQLFPYIDRVYVTKLFCAPESCRFFQNLDEDKNWQCIEAGPVLEEDGIGYSFCTYERINKGE